MIADGDYLFFRKPPNHVVGDGCVVAELATLKDGYFPQVFFDPVGAEALDDGSAISVWIVHPVADPATPRRTLAKDGAPTDMPDSFGREI